MARLWIAASLFTFMLAVPAFAADDKTDPADTATPLTIVKPVAPSRGSLLLGLYVSNAALNVYDGVSTTAALQRGNVEANPLMKGIAGNSIALWSVKAGMTTASIVIAERLWKQHHRGQAIGMMIAMNGIMTAVAMNNASVLRSVK